MARDYREKTVTGMITDGKHLGRTPVTVRMTSDKKGQTLSLNVGEIMMAISLEDVQDIIRVTEKR